MNFIASSLSDIGIKRMTNQDALSVTVVDTDFGQVLFAIICDGIGGLSKGELASSTLVGAFNDWFENSFKDILYKELNSKRLFKVLKKSWNSIIQLQNEKIKQYGLKHNIQLGSTISLLLCFNNNYYVAHVGDTRIYLLSNDITQITKDQTLLQQEIDNNKGLSEEEIKNFPKKNVLLQCVGVGDVVPSFYMGSVTSNSSFLLCSDGFRNKVSDIEIFNALNYDMLNDKQSMNSMLSQLTDTAKHRLEKDNISSIVVKSICNTTDTPISKRGKYLSISIKTLMILLFLYISIQMIVLSLNKNTIFFSVAGVFIFLDFLLILSITEDLSNKSECIFKVEHSNMVINSSDTIE